MHISLQFIKLISQISQMKENSRVQAYANKINEFISDKQYKRIVLQLPKELLIISFDLISSLRKSHPNRQFFALYDSLKQPCCTDKLGAEHVNYDCLIHFGHACFSSPHQKNHFYILEEGNTQAEARIKVLLASQQIFKSISFNNIGYLVVDQPYYEFVKRQVELANLNVEFLKLSYDAKENDQYLFFGYYSRNISIQLKNVMIITDQNPDDFDQKMGFTEKIIFSLKSMHQKLGQKIFKLGIQEGQIVEQKANISKRLMQRYSIASQIENYNVFGILVSNTAASFVNKTVSRCQQILKSQKKKCFLFMMNNLNEVKLGNFPEIEVYVIVSCFNHSLFTVKDFHKLVVTPTDLQIAFQKRNFDEYDFDLNSKITFNHPTYKQEEISEEAISTEIQKAHNQEVALQNKIQTLAYYQEREFKGLTFSDKKEIKKFSKGKIGLAQQYTKLQ